MKYLAPDAVVVSLGYDWAPYDAVYPFGIARGFEEVASWYQRTFPECGNEIDEKGKYEAHFLDRSDDSEWSVLLADASVETAVADFFSYVACTELESEVVPKGYRTIGGLFRHKKSEARE